METVKRRLQFLVVLVLFLPVIFDALGLSSKSTTDWSIVLPFYIATFLFFELFSKHLWHRAVLLVNGIILVNIFAFIPLLYLIVKYRDAESLNSFVEFSISTLIVLLYVLPALLLIILSLNFLFWCFTLSKK